MKLLFNRSACFVKKLSASIFILIAFQTIQAQNTFTGLGGDNDWNNSLNWSGGIPTVTDDVILPNGVVAIINGSGVAATLTMNSGSVFIIQTGSLDLSGAFTQNGGNFILSAGCTASVNGFTTFPSAGITLSGNLDIKGGTWVNGANVSSLSGKVYNFSSLTTNNNASIALSSGGEINGPFDGTNEGVIASSINLTSGSISSLSVSSTIKIKGTFTIPAGTFAAGNSVISTYGTSTISAGSGIQLNNITVNAGSALSLNTTGTVVSVSGVTNDGTITINGLYQFADFTNSSTLTNNGTLLISSSFTNNGTYNSGNPSNLDFNGSGAMTVGGTFANPINNLVHSGNGDLTGNTSFTINGNYSNTGSGKGEFLTGTITFSGTGKTINGGLQGTTFNNMIITGSYEAAQKVNLSGVLDLSTAGTFDADGPSNTATFTIKSTSLTATGSIASLGTTPNRLSGNMTIERFYTPPSTNGSWQYMSFPFSSTITVQDLQNAGFQVNGHFTSGASLVNESMFTYLPNAANDGTGWLGIGWGGGATSAYQLLNNVGYVALAYPSNSPNNLISLTGVPAKGDITNIAITGGSGQYNLIPNPYPAPLNFVALQAANPGLLSTTVEVETQIASAGVGNSTTGSTASYTTAGVCTNCPAGWDGTKIAPGQSFWVTAAGTGNLTVTESMKSSSGTYVGRIAQETPKDYVRISLLSGNMKDESVILFREGAKETFNVINDAKKRLSGDPVDGTELRTYVNVGTLKPGTPEPLVFNFSPLLTPIANKNVKLYVQVASAGAHSLKFTDLETFTLGYQFTLIDKFLNKQVEVKNGTEYAFTTTDVAASYALDRFELSIAREEVQTAANDEADKWVAYPNPSQGSFAIHVPSSVTTDQIKIVDSKGNAVSSVVTKSENTVSIDLSNQPSGLYIIRVQDGSLNRRVKVIKK